VLAFTRSDDGGERDPVSEQLHGIEADLVLADEAADAGYLGDAGNGFKRVAQMPLLQGAQVGEGVGSALVDDGVFEDPSRGGGIGAYGGSYAFGQAATYLLEILKDAGTGPVEIGSILKDDEDKGVAQHGLPADRFDAGRGQQASHDGISDLVFDDIGGWPAQLVRTMT